MLSFEIEVLSTSLIAPIAEGEVADLECNFREETLQKKTLAQQSCIRKAGFLYLLKQQFSFSLKYKY